MLAQVAPSAKTKAKAAALKREVALVIFGFDSKKKPHAASFAADEVELATKAAGLMKMAVWRVTAAGQALAARVPKGKLFGSGRAFTPLISAKLMAELQLAAGPTAMPGERPDPTSGTAMPRVEAVEAAGGPSADSGGTPTGSGLQAASDSPRRPPDWGGISIGCEVLADSGEEGRGWFEAIVLRQADNDLFELQWHHFPEEPLIVRRREDLGLIHSQHVREPFRQQL